MVEEEACYQLQGGGGKLFLLFFVAKYSASLATKGRKRVLKSFLKGQIYEIVYETDIEGKGKVKGERDL